MATITVLRITHEDGIARCEELFVEYVAWVLAQFRALHDADLPEGAEAAVQEEFRRDYPKILSERGRMLLVTVDGAPAGVGALKPLSADAVELKRMYVRPAHRGLGLSRLVLDRLIADARALGYRTMQLDTAAFMTAAHHLYRSVGFVDRGPYESETLRNGVANHALFMTLDLTAS